jgi:hypothetical protein
MPSCLAGRTQSALAHFDRRPDDDWRSGLPVAHTLPLSEQNRICRDRSASHCGWRTDHQKTGTDQSNYSGFSSEGFARDVCSVIVNRGGNMPRASKTRIVVSAEGTLLREAARLSGIEPPRVSRRPNFLRGWVYRKSEQVFTRSTRASGAHGVGTRARARIVVGGHEVDRGQDWMHGGDSA